MCEKKAIGILGGMGPLATADLFQKITLLTEAETDRDHIRVYIDSNANIPDRTAAILSNGPDPVPEMASALRNLEACGADCVIMPCNTAHYFLPRLQAMTEIPFLSILTAAAETCKAQFPGMTVGILATKGTLSAQLYQNALGEAVAPFSEQICIFVPSAFFPPVTSSIYPSSLFSVICPLPLFERYQR